jgi:tetratricopeptide (TPR) repeat protein
MRAEPNAFEGALALARTYAKLGRMTDAVSRFEQSITLAPADSVEIYLELADVLRRARRDTDALRWLNRGIAERGSLLTLELAAFDAEVRLRQYDDAIARIERVSAPMARKESYLLMKGETEIRAGRFCAARVSLNDAKKGFESRTSFQRNLRAVKSELARLAAALKKTGSCRE